MSSMALDGSTPRSRTTDPITSVDAGRAADLNRSQRQVLALFEHITRPVADHELVRTAELMGLPFTAQRIRSARSELAELGRVVLVEGEFKRTKTGRRAQVWTLADRKDS